PGPDDGHLLTSKTTEVRVLGGVGDKFGRKVPQWFGPPSKLANPGCHDDASGLDFFSISQSQLEPSGIGFDPRDLPLVNIRHDLALEPVAVTDEMIQWDGSAELTANRLAVGIQRQHALGIGKV